MFNGVPEAQFHQFIASRSALSLPLPVTFPFHVPPAANSNFSNNIHELQPPYNQHFQSHHLLHHQPQPAAHEPPDSCTHEEEEKEEEEKERVGGRMSLEVVKGVGSVAQQMDPWSKEEVLALLTIRSSMGNNEFSDFIWGHVSRKLAELGFKRSAEKCKEKFEEVSKYSNNSNTGNYSNYCRSSFNELDALFEYPNQKSMDEDSVRTNVNEEGNNKMGQNLEESSGNETLENPVVEDHHQQVVKKPRRKKRKKQHKLELLKGFSEFVSKVMIQQEQLHKRLLEDMQRREEERVAREEAWRKKESNRLNKEFEIRAKEQAIACDREATIIEFLKKFTRSGTSSQFQKEDLLKTPDRENTEYSQATSPSTVLAQSSSKGPASALVPVPETPISVAHKSNNPTNPPTSSYTMVQTTKNPNSGANQNNPPVPSNSYTPVELPAAPSTKSNRNITTSSTVQNSNFISNEIRDHGKRWPRDEVNSLINLRCNLYNSTSSSTEDQKGGTKAPLWERISQGMLELGYKRSAKKCKEKWENINKYFRKTKDTNKKRSVDSKTCPYFHQLSSLYNQGKLSLLPSESEAPENFLETPESRVVRNCSVGFDDDDREAETMVHVDEGAEKNIAQVSPLEFQY